MTAAAQRAARATEKLLVERRDRVLVLTLNRPEVRNAIDTETALIDGVEVPALAHLRIGRLGLPAGAG